MALHLTPEDRALIFERYQQGTSLRQIGREVGRPGLTVRRVLESMGVDFGPARTTNQRTAPEVEARVIELYDSRVTWDEIMRECGVTGTTLSKILKRGVRSLDRQPEAAAPKAPAITALYDSGLSTRQIGSAFGHSKSTVNRVIAASGTALRHIEGCEYPDYFETIDTPAKAYWLGFISADGCIVTTDRHPEGNHLALQLAERDKGHLEKLKAALGANAAVRTGVSHGFGRPTGNAMLAVGSRRLTMSLLALGVGPRKSATHEPWSGAPELMPHYWRGVFDGDGSLARKSAGRYTAFLCGSEACVRAFTHWAGQICGTKATPYYRTGCWYVSIGGRHQVARLVETLYRGAPISLDRKQQIAERILDAAANPASGA